MFTLLDSNLLVYAINISSPKHLQAKAYLESGTSFCLAQQNIFETLRVLTHSKFTSPMPINQALATVFQIASACFVIAPKEETYHVAGELIKKYQLAANQIFDVYLVATMLTNEVETIATDNTRDFSKYAEITTYNPFVP